MQHLHSSSIFVRGILLLSIALAYLIHSITSLDLANFLVILVVLTFFISWPSMSKFPKVVSILLVIIGNVLFLIGDESGEYWKEAILNNVGLVALFTSVPLLSYPLRHGGYIKYMDDFIRNFLKSDIKIIGFVTAITCVISSFLNLGSLRVIYDLFSQRFANRKKIFAKSMLPGFSLAAIWSPYFAGVAITLHLVGISFQSFIIYGLLMVVISFATSLLFNVGFIRSEKKKGSYQLLAISAEKEMPMKQIERTIHHRKGIELLLVFAGMFLSLFLLERWLHYNVLILISLVAFTYPIIWSILIHKLKEFIFSMKDYAVEVVPNIHNESIMIITATFFSQMVKLTSFPDFLSTIFLNISELSIFLTVLTIIIFCVTISLFIHQVLPVSVFATTLSPEVIGLKPELFVLALVVSWGLMPIISPVSASNLIIGNLFKTKTFEVGIWNLKYIVAIIFLTSLLISFLNMFTF